MAFGGGGESHRRSELHAGETCKGLLEVFDAGLPIKSNLGAAMFDQDSSHAAAKFFRRRAHDGDMRAVSRGGEIRILDVLIHAVGFGGEALVNGASVKKRLMPSQQINTGNNPAGVVGKPGFA